LFIASLSANPVHAPQTIGFVAEKHPMHNDPEVTLVRNYLPGTIGRIAGLHATYYARHWHFGLFFEAKVATELSAFLTSFDDTRDGIWLAVKNGQIEGGVFIDGSNAQADGAHLRWFILSGHLRGHGVGRRLLDEAVHFCDRRQYRRTYLWTFEGLDAARHLYAGAGFRLTLQRKGTQWGIEVNEQRFERTAG
jgi:GNAT superfamily N-acetyltransferase